MPKKINVRNILEAKLRSMSNNEIATAYHCSKHSVQDVVTIATGKGILPSGKIPELSDEEPAFMASLAAFRTDSGWNLLMEQRTALTGL